MLLALILASVGAISLAGLLLLIAVALGLYVRHWLGLARRSSRLQRDQTCNAASAVIGA